MSRLIVMRSGIKTISKAIRENDSEQAKDLLDELYFEFSDVMSLAMYENIELLIADNA